MSCRRQSSIKRRLEGRNQKSPDEGEVNLVTFMLQSIYFGSPRLRGTFSLSSHHVFWEELLSTSLIEVVFIILALLLFCR